MTFDQIRQSMMPLLEDAAEAEANLDINPRSQFARRTYVRSSFSLIEGAIWILKGVCLNAKPASNIKQMAVPEYMLLKEESYEIKTNGEISTSQKFVRLADNLRFTFKVINRMTNSKLDLGIGLKPWNEFLLAIEVRNRITHPKTVASFTITDKEIDFCKNTVSWFNNLVFEAVQGFLSQKS